MCVLGAGTYLVSAWDSPHSLVGHRMGNDRSVYKWVSTMQSQSPEKPNLFGHLVTYAFFSIGALCSVAFLG